MSRFYRLAAVLACVFAASTTVEAVNRYTEQRLALRWRDWLTRQLLHRYVAGRACHHLACRDDVDNPDQRISEDVRSFTTSSLAFLILLANGILSLLACAGVLCSITPWLFPTA